MTIKVVEKQVTKFIHSPSSNVITINGEWGTGKTYFWNQSIRKARDKNLIKKESYSYVSLYGVNSIADLRRLIVHANIRKENFNQIDDLKTLSSKVKNKSEMYGWSAVALRRLHFSIINTDVLAADLDAKSFNYINNSIICLDDLERKGLGLSFREILGLINELKKQRNCKVSLILNYTELDESDKKEFDKYREKTIDIGLLYSPTAEEAAAMAFSNMSFMHEIIKEYSAKLSINNIRTLKRIEKLTSDVIELVSQYDNEIMSYLIQRIVLFTWSSYNRTSTTPCLDYILNVGSKVVMLNKNTPDNEKEFIELLRRYNYFGVTRLDRMIAECISCGFIDNLSIFQETSKLAHQYKQDNARNMLQEAWGAYRNSFQNDGENVYLSIKNILDQVYMLLSPSELDQNIGLYRVLGKDEEADSIITKYIKDNIDTLKNINNNCSPFNLVEDAKFQAEISKIHEEQSDEKTLEKAVYNISDQSIWDKDDTEIIRNATIDDLYLLFKDNKSPKLQTYVKNCLALNKYNTEGALRKIAEESPLNRKRVSSIGVE